MGVVAFRSAMSRSLFFVIATATCFLVSARAQWQVNQRSHQLTELNDASLQKVCQMTDIAVIKSILKPLLVERIVDTPGHKTVGEYLKSKADEYGLTTEWDEFKAQTPHGVKHFRNLIATYDAMAPRRIVLACHYDSKILRGQVFIAATDSAVPCAIILDIARTLGPIIHQRSNKHITLQLLFLDGEEAFVDWNERDSLYGARHLADHWAKKWYPSTDGSSFDLNKEIDRIDVLMLLDLIGAANPRFTSTVGHGTTPLFQDLPRIEDKLKNLGCMKHVPKMFFPGTSWAAVEDDHIPFMRKGVPIMHMISVPFPSVWHTARDNESILDYNTIENAVSVVRVFVAKYLGINP